MPGRWSVVPGSVPDQWDLLKPQLATALAEVDALGEPVVRDPAMPFGERGHQFRARQMHAEAAVVAGAEPELVGEVGSRRGSGRSC